MDISANYGFYLPSRDGDDIADINQISDNFKKIDKELSEMIKGKGVDQTYNPTSTNPQSGTAVAGAVENFISREEETEWIFDGGDASGSIKIINPVDSEMSDESDNAVQNKVVKKYVDDRSIDYVVEQGTDGIWKYRKWASGVAECWGSETISFTPSEAWGAVYLQREGTSGGAWGKTVHFPSGLFNLLPSHSITLCESGFLLLSFGLLCDENAFSFSPASIIKLETEITTDAHYMAVGRWKD